MSAHNFWNNFTHGFMHGMFNSNPFFGCFGGFGGWNYFGCGFGMPFMFNSCFTDNLFPVPNVMNSGFYPMMQDMTPPSMEIGSIFDNPFKNVKWNTASINTNTTVLDFTSTSVQPSYFTSFSTVTSPGNTKTKAEKLEFTYDAKALKQKWASKKPNLSDEFYAKVVNISKNIKCSPDDLMALMYSESGIDPAKTNGIGATGLIQFLPSTAKSLGTSTAELKKMSAVKQLDYVEKCILANKKMAGYGKVEKLNTGTLYALTFLPAYAKRETLSTKGDKYYAQNKGLDRNKDGKITKSDLAARLQGYYA